MLEINEVEIKRILNPTYIDLGEYVINPYMGCEFSCLYCYVRSNRVVSKKNKSWGEFLDIRINAPLLLEKELLIKKPKTVLLGSTTECFQPAENRYHITEKVLEILNKNKIHYVILTRSTYILNYINLLKTGFCKNIYFTINDFSHDFKNKLEPKTPSFESRLEAVKKLIEENITVIPYFSPVLPFISEYNDIFKKLNYVKTIEFECINFRLKNFSEIINKIGEVNLSIMEKYKKMGEDRVFYYSVWEEIKNKIALNAKNTGINFNIYIHKFEGYFENKYN